MPARAVFLSITRAGSKDGKNNAPASFACPLIFCGAPLPSRKFHPIPENKSFFPEKRP